MPHPFLKQRFVYISFLAAFTMSQHLLPIFQRIFLQPAASLLIRLRSTPPGRRSLAWAAACLAFARQVWPQGLKGHAKCNMGSGQQC